MEIKKGHLYIVGTPIGNLGDMSPRGLEVLTAVDFVAAEDTRVTGKLLHHFGIKKPMVSYHEHNLRERGLELLRRLQDGESGALCTDAGMPAISDPGQDVVQLCHREGIPVVTVPGPTAVTTALALSGFPSGRFTFEGFLSTGNKNRRAHLQELVTEKRTMIFYEAPHKLKKTLEDMGKSFGEDRPIALCRELTKLYEEAEITTLGAALLKYKSCEPKGEFVLIIEGRQDEEKVQSNEAILAALQEAKAKGLRSKDAIREVSLALDVNKNLVYQIAVKSGE